MGNFSFHNNCARGFGMLGLGLVLSAGVATAQDNDRTAEYVQILNQIEDMKLNIAHKNVYIETQNSEIESLKKQIAGTGDVVQSIDPMLEKMAAAISSEVDKDIPFNALERYERLSKLQEILSDGDARPSDKMRWALRTYEEEVNYGQTVETYTGDSPIAEKRGARYEACISDYKSGACALNKDQLKRIEEQGVTVEELKPFLSDGNFLRYGRLALTFVSADESEVYRFDPPTKTWEKMSGGRALDAARAVRAAKGESAPAVVEAPIYIAN